MSSVWRRWVFVTIAGLSGAICHADAALRTLSVEDVTTGTLRPFNGVTGAPGAGFGGPETPPAVADIDISDAYRAAHIDLIRTHDHFGPGDIDARFGVDKQLPMSIPSSRDAYNIFPDMGADPKDEKSYHFEATDRLIASIEGIGAEPIFRIGRSIGADPTPPADLDKYAEIARRIVMHYNLGWNHGFHYRIRYWEIWNEPDFKVFWTGTPQQYYELYEKAALAIKAADSTALIGGPTISKPLDATPYREAFLDFVKAKKLPLDFFVWHYYSMDANDPNNFISIAKVIRSLLDERGFKNTKSFLDEWNVDLFERDMSKASRAAFTASSLIYMVGAPIDAQAYYRADPSFRNAERKPDAIGNALTAFGMMTNTPELLRTTGSDDAGFAVMAARSKDRKTRQVLISNYQIAPKSLGPRTSGNVLHIPNIMDVTMPARRSLAYHDNGGYDLSVHVPPGKYLVTRYRISDSDNFAQIDQTTEVGPVLHLQAVVAAPSIEFIRIQTQ
jgi:xylan 1,4-beta-xylosidase